MPLSAKSPDKLIRRIARQYGLGEVRVGDMQKGYRNRSFPLWLPDGTARNLIIYKSEPDMLARIRRANTAGNFLHAAGLPARHTASEQIIRLSGKHHYSYGALYSYLPGHTIPWEAYTHAHLKLLGKTLSDLHAVFRTASFPALPEVALEYEQILTRMQHYFARPGVMRALDAKLGLALTPQILPHLATLMRACRGLPGQQPLHMDFVRGNVLFEETAGQPALIGIIDFEKIASGHPLFDIARTLAFLLVDCMHKTERDVRKYFLISGYARRGQARFANLTFTLRGRHIDLLEELCTLFLLHDLYKFLLHNPYEYLPQNHHFVRTKAQLLTHGIITTPHP